MDVGCSCTIDAFFNLIKLLKGSRKNFIICHQNSLKLKKNLGNKHLTCWDKQIHISQQKIEQSQN